MPIIKSAQKRMRQNTAIRVRRHAQSSRMRSLYKNIINWVGAGQAEKAQEFATEAQKMIDLCAKKNIIHKNNAAHKKARIAKLLNQGQPQKAPAKAPKSAEPAAEA